MSLTGNGVKRWGFIVSFCVGASLVAWAQPPSAASPVVLEGRTVFTVEASLGPFSAQDRAAATSARLANVVTDLTASLDAIATVIGEGSTDVTLRDRVLFTVTDADAAAASRSRDVLVAEHIRSVRVVVTELRTDYSSQSLLRGSIETVLITLALIVLLIVLGKVRTTGIKKLHGKHFPPIRIQNVELISGMRIRQTLVQGVKGLRLFLVLAALYLYLPLVLSLFPWTREYAPQLLEYIVGPLRSAEEAVVDYLPSLFVVILCSAGAYLLIRVSFFLFREVENGSISWPGFYPEWAGPTHKIVRFLILAITVVVIFPYLPGSGSPAFQGVSIFIGVLLSLGSTSAVANIIGGVILTYTRAFDIGDRVKIADTIGDVMEKTLLATRIRTIKNEFITVPNSMVLGSHIINFSSHQSDSPLVLHTSVTIGYDAPWRKVHELLIAAALRTEHIIPNPSPYVLQTSLNDFYVTYQLNAHTSEPSRMAATYAGLHQNIQDCFNEAGVEIMSSHYASLRDGNFTTIPAGNRPADYSAPSFRVERTDQRPAESGESKRHT